LALMLSGRKPAAMFSDMPPLDCSAPLLLFRPHVRSGRFTMRVDVIVLRPNLRVRFIYYARRGENWRIERLRQLNRQFFHGGNWSDADDEETGRLLGYSERDIAAFLARKRAVTRGR
jgi:hypothetical protein